MAKYDGLIIPRSYNDYINKSDPIGVLQALALNGVMDAAPTENSEKPAKSGGIYAALAGKQPALTFDDVPTDGSNNPVKSNGIYDALAEKQNTLTFDNTPTENSDNPVKSGGIFAANAVITSDNATLTGVAISAGSVVRVLFTADLTGSDATTGLTLTYNGNAYAVKVGKNGALAAFVASEISSGVFKYLQTYTTLELMFDGTQFIIIGNPVVLSSADYTIYADGTITYTKTREDALLGLRPEIYSADITVTTDAHGIAEITRFNLPIGFYNCSYVVTFFNGAGAGFAYFMQVKDYNGNPVANQEVSMRLIFIPNILGITQHQN